MLKIYGHPQQRTFRTLWMAEELSIPYERIKPDQRSPDFRKINPNGRVPAIQDGDVTLFESMAINLYLASRYGREKGLWPSSTEDQGRAYQWSFWAMTETEAHMLEFVIHSSLPAAQRSEVRMKAAEDKLQAALPVLDGALQDRPYLLGSTFTVADLNVGSVLALLRLPRVNLDASGFPRAWDWLARVTTRPAVEKARKS